MSRRNDEVFRVYTTLSQKGSVKNPIFAETACVNPEIRELIGFIDLFNDINGLKKEDKVFQVERKALIHFGRLIWPRTEISDLGFLLGEGVKRINIKKGEEPTTPITDPDFEPDL